MAIIPDQFCENCAEHGDAMVPAEHELDSWGFDSGGGGYLCGNCYTNAAEAAHERKIEAYYGSSSPQSIAEHYDAAVRQRAELRKRD